MIIRFYNCRLVKSNSIELGELWVENEVFTRKRKSSDHEVDLKGMLVAPGFIDIQVNGAYGHDFSKDPLSISQVAKQITETGVTAFCPTIVSSDKSTYRNLPDISTIPTEQGEAEVLGYHLEGPYINLQFRGAHERISIDDKEFRDTYLSVPSVKMVTLAPEVEGALDLTRSLIAKGVVVSVGHTNANEKEIRSIVETGASAVTHLFNAMKPFHHRDPGVIGFILTSKQLYYSMIVDPWHLDPSAIQIAWQMHPEGVILVSDSMAGMGLADGQYFLGEKEVVVENEKALIKDTNTLAGSVASLDCCLRRFRNITSCTIPEVIATVTEKPASLLGVYPKKGSFEVGADANFVVLDEALFVNETYVKGCKSKKI